MPLKLIVVAEPSGFCAGVRRAVDLMEQALREQGPPLYCYRELVHNRQVIDRFSARGVHFVSSLDEVPAGANLFFSAHGVAPELVEAARRREVRVIDATCPFVARIHAKVRQFVAAGCRVFLVGHRDHDEVLGVVGEAPGQVMVIENPEEAAAVQVPAGVPLALVTQTTLSVDDTARTVAVLRQRFPELATLPASDICLAVKNRQRGVRQLAAVARRVLVLGSRNSSNSQRLVEVARAAGAEAFLISAVEEVGRLDWSGVETVGLTAGASTPDDFVREVIAVLRGLGEASVSRLCVGAEELVSEALSEASGGGHA